MPSCYQITKTTLERVLGTKSKATRDASSASQTNLWPNIPYS